MGEFSSPPFLSPLLSLFSYPSNIEIIFDNSDIITKIYPPFQNPGSALAEGKLAIPQPHTNYMKNSFSYSGAVLWNSLPIELRQADSLSAFRAALERFFSSS